MPFSISTRALPQTLVVSVGGELDIATAGRLRSVLLDALAEPDVGVLVDLADVRFMDSSGLAVVIGGWKRAVAGGRAFALARPATSVARLLELTRTDQLMAVLDEVRDLTSDDITEAALTVQAC
jgi:anti-sigma B factor antagonist